MHADVFRPPTENPMLLTVFVGTGAQLFFMCLVTIAFAAVGFLSPANRGSLMIAVLLTYVLMGSVAGKKLPFLLLIVVVVLADSDWLHPLPLYTTHT